MLEQRRRALEVAEAVGENATIVGDGQGGRRAAGEDLEAQLLEDPVDLPHDLAITKGDRSQSRRRQALAADGRGQKDAPVPLSEGCQELLGGLRSEERRVGKERTPGRRESGW